MNNLVHRAALLIITVGLVLIAIFTRGLYKTTPQQKPTSLLTVNRQSEEVNVTLTDPSPLDQAIVLPNKTISISFNFPLENGGEFKYRFDPTIQAKVALSTDRKTILITPELNLGNGYTLFIQTDSKFDGGKKLPKEIIYHFRTVSYRGV